jgi:hypothetical protein
MVSVFGPYNITNLHALFLTVSSVKMAAFDNGNAIVIKLD